MAVVSFTAYVDVYLLPYPEVHLSGLVTPLCVGLDSMWHDYVTLTQKCICPVSLPPLRWLGRLLVVRLRAAFLSGPTHPSCRWCVVWQL